MTAANHTGSAIMCSLLLVLAAAQLGFAGEEPSPLRPDVEVENYTTHDVDPASVRFKPGKGLEFKSTDGLFSLAMGLRAMFLYELNNDPSLPSGDQSTQEVMIRRARITFAGNMWGKDNKYKIELAISPKDEAVDSAGSLTQTPLLTWTNSFTQIRDLNLRIGQYKIPYSRERVISSSKLVHVDRSPANKAFNLDRDIGLDVGSEDLFGANMLQYNLGIYAGEGRGRFEPQDFDRTGPRLSIGVAYAFVDNPVGAKNILDEAPEEALYDYHNATADLLFKAYGFSLEGAFFWRDGGDQYASFAETGTGYFAQPGYLLPGTGIGLAGRWSQVMPEADSALSTVHEVGPSVSYYFAGARNKMKLQADYLRSWGEDAAEGENLARLQLQCML